MAYVKFSKFSLKKSHEYNEQWLQDRIAEDPTILGLGDVFVKDKERRQPRAGRLDLLLQHADTDDRYEVEIQLGAVDESHIIRTIEYWNLEKKRYPQYEHTAVIIAEDITSRFFNVISLFNGAIPLIAIQLSALKLGEDVGLVFTTVMDQVTLGLVDDDEEVYDSANRPYWLDRGSKESLKIVDGLFKIAQKLEAGLELKYNKAYIGHTKASKTSNFVRYRPKKSFVTLEANLEKTEENLQKAEEAGFSVMEFTTRSKRFRIKVFPDDMVNKATFLEGFIKAAYESTDIQ
ncbi:hypothetical protein JYU19_00305 [bacterium AH-315-J21]|nr:hypothetical protein [bacterium AH-315-J21]